MLQKDVYPYRKYMNYWNKFIETLLPEKGFVAS